jgi:hypothetical protein
MPALQSPHQETATFGPLEVPPLRVGIEVRREDVPLLFGTEGNLDRIAVLAKGDLALAG